MKTKVLLFVVLVLILIVHARGTALEELRNAYKYGAEAKLVYQVVDDECKPVCDATAHVWFLSYGREQDNADWIVRTDSNGVFVVVHRLNEKFSCIVNKAGYYQSRDERSYFDMKANAVRDGKWQPYGESRKLVLKRIKDPYAVKVFSGERCHRKIPVFGKWVSFDMERFDWLPPHGNGMHEDVLLRFEKTTSGKWHEFSYSMEACFTNNPYAGVYCKSMDKHSDLSSGYFADTNACYRSKYVFSVVSAPESAVEMKGLERNSYLVFRIRTKVDENGALIAAHYGKICSSWRSDGTEMHVGGGCFNPTENDANIEGDQSLFYTIKNYKSKED